MPHIRATYKGEVARKLARYGMLSGKMLHPHPWWPEAVCEKIEKIVWKTYCLGDPGDEWHEYIAYDGKDRVLAVHRKEGY